MRRRIEKCRVGLAAMAAIAAIAGCGSDGANQVDVHGSVAYRGQAVPGGTVLFQPQSGKAIIAVIDAGGRYQMAAPVGTYRVAVVASAGIPDGVDPWQPNAKLPPPVVPEKFGRPETSDTSVEVTPNSETLDIRLQ